MLIITIDSSMLTGKSHISDCELTVNVAGCAWDEDSPIPCKLTKEEMMDFFYPWRWEEPNQIVIQWLDDEGKQIKDDQGNIIEESLSINLDGYDEAAFSSDKELVKTEHYEEILNNKIIEVDDEGNVVIDENECIKLKEKEIRFDFDFDSGSGDIEKIRDIVVEDQTDSSPNPNPNTGFLYMSIGKFAQKLSPLNLGLNLTFFAKGSNIILPEKATQFVVYLRSDSENNRWNSVCDGESRGKTEKGQQVISFHYPDDTEKSMVLYSLVTPIPTTNDKSKIIQLRNEEGEFLGNTKVDVYDSEELLNKKEFKEKIIRKTSSIFDLPGLLYEYLKQNSESIKDIEENKFSDWCRQIKELFIILLRDAYSIGNELNSANSAEILKDLVKRYNDSIDIKSEYIELNNLETIVKRFSDFDKTLSSAGWQAFVESSGILNTKLTEINVPAQNLESIEHWLNLWKAVVDNKHSEDETELRNEIIKNKNDLLKLQIIKVINDDFLGNSDNSKKLFSEVADKFFENYSPSNLFIESIAIDINGNKDDSQFQTSELVEIKTILHKTCLIDYVVQRKKGNKLFPSISGVLSETNGIESVPFPETGEKFWEKFVEFAVNYNFANADQVVSLNLDEEINELLTSNLNEKVTDIPPNVLIKVDDVETEDDLSDEISGHLLLMQRARDIHQPVPNDVEWKCLNWSRINLINKIENKQFKLENDYLIPSFLPLSDELKNFYLTLSNERLSLVAGHDFFNDEGDDDPDDSKFQLQYLFDNGTAQHPKPVPPAYALWYGYNYNFAGFVALNSGVLATALRTDNWVTFKVNEDEIKNSPKTAYPHLRRVPFSKIYSNVLRENKLPISPIPDGLLTITSELEENNKVDKNNNRKELPVYLLYDNQKGNKQEVVNIELGKPLTNFWNWYAWNGNKLTNQQLQVVLNEELKVRGKSDIRNEYLHDPALENKLLVSVDQIFPTPKSKGDFIMDLAETNPGDILSKIKNGFVKVEISTIDEVEVDNKNRIIKMPEGFVVKLSVKSLTKKKHFDENTKRFHPWMTKILDSQIPMKINNVGEEYYLTKPVEMIFEAAKRPYKKEKKIKKYLVSSLQIWESLIPIETEQKQIALNLEKKHQNFAYFSRTIVDHQVWHWNGRLSESLLKNATLEEVAEFPENLNPKLLKNLQPANDKPETYGETNYAMKWEAWEFSDRPDSSALRYTTNLRAVKSTTKNFEQQTIFTDIRQADEKALYYRFSAELFGRYELLGGDYVGSVRSAISIIDEDSRDKEVVDNQWKRYFKPSRKTARLPKPVIRFVIPLTSSIDECQKYDDVRSASLMIVMNDRWFSEMGLAEKCEIGIELLKYPYLSNNTDEQKHYLNAGLDPIISGKGLNPVNPNKEGLYIEKPEPAANKIDKENPVAVFTPEGPAGLTYDFATATPKLKGSTFILKVDDINQFLTKEQEMNAWSMVQIAARRNVDKPLWELSNEHFSSVIWNFCKLDSENADIERPKISKEFIDDENQAEFSNKLHTLWLCLNGNEKDKEKFKKIFEEIIEQYNRSKKRAALEKETFKGIKSEWTAKEWVQFIPDTNSMIPLQWKKENTNYGFVSFQQSEGNVIKPKSEFDFPTLSAEKVSYEAKTERYIVISEKTQNAGGQPVEKYKATYKYKETYKFDKVEKYFVLNDPKESPPNFDSFVEGYARIILVRVPNNSKSDISIWEKLFGENKEKTVGFKDIQDDPKAALPLISKKFAIKIKN